MSTSVELRIELPTFSHSFPLQVPSSSTVLSLKELIQQSSIRGVAGPRVDGQRIIFRGRFLSDHERIEDLWKSHDEPRIIHLAVHPSAWPSGPPITPPNNVPQDPIPSPPVLNWQDVRPLQSSLRTQAPPTPSTRSLPQPLSYIHHRHQTALAALMRNDTVPPLDFPVATRAIAMTVLERHGFSWPEILDEEFPPPEEGGLIYERTTIDGKSYLSLQNPSATPTAKQIHALRTLSATFVILDLPPAPIPRTAIHPQQLTIPPHVNQMLQQLGLPALRIAGQNHPAEAPNRILPDIPLGPFLLPIVMLLFRTMLLLYFVAPARKPVFGVLILAWVLYEIWRPIRNALQRVRPPGEEIPHQAPRADAGGRVVPPAHDGVAQDGAADARRERPRPRAPLGGGNEVLDTLAHVNLDLEERALAGEVTEPLSIGQKAMLFISLLTTTVHPAVWDRRRVQLRQREGRIRTEADARESLGDTEEGDQDAARIARHAEMAALHARRAPWVQQYAQRMVEGDWADDSD